MLLSFRFANHRSFRDEQQLNLLPVYEGADSGAPESLAAVPVVGVFGANASGKSNVLSALNYVSTMPGSGDGRPALKLCGGSTGRGHPVHIRL
jgi:AAA15 family ATPase/GTPase